MKKKNPKYIGKNYDSLIFQGELSYKNFIKIHNFKSQIPLPLPSCDCIFQSLSDALKKDSIKEKLFAMGRLEGFLLPMASAVLHFSNPKMYPIIDKNVRKAMGKLGWKKRESMEIDKRTVSFYEYYVGKIQILAVEGNVRELANKFSITPIRLIEAAMYQLGKE